MSFDLLARATPLRWILYRLARWRVGEKLAAIETSLGPGDRTLDIGAGNCVLCEQLRARGHTVVPLDLANHSFVDAIAPQVYDGRTLPFADDSFDLALIVTVLHHVRDPTTVLAEAARVAKRILVVEEIYENAVERYATYAIDSLFNLEFFGHPRSNKTDAGWREVFTALGLLVVDASYSRSLGFLKRVTYSLVRAEREPPPGR